MVSIVGLLTYSRKELTNRHDDGVQWPATDASVHEDLHARHRNIRSMLIVIVIGLFRIMVRRRIMTTH